MFDLHDLRPTIIPKSDQLNAEQLLGGAITVTVTNVAVSDSAEQPVTISYSNDDGRPYKPCKTMRKVLILAWGQDGSAWVGKSMTLYNDPAVKFGGAAVGGIRISHLSGIDRDIAVSLTATKGKKTLHTIKALRTPAPPKKDDASPAAQAKRMSNDVAAGNAADVAGVLADWPQERRDAVWAHFSEATAEALIAAWPNAEQAA